MGGIREEGDRDYRERAYHCINTQVAQFILSTPISLGYVKEFLSARFWIPLSRLNFSAYLIHVILLNLMFVGHKTGLHYTKYLMVLIEFFSYSRLLKER